MNICTSWGPASFRKVAWGGGDRIRPKARQEAPSTQAHPLSFSLLPISLILPKALTLVCAAQARASRVFPAPGARTSARPFGGWIPKFSNFSLWFIGRTMASTSCQEEDLGEDRNPVGSHRPTSICSPPTQLRTRPSLAPHPEDTERHPTRLADSQNSRTGQKDV